LYGDPSESKDLAAQNSDVVAQLQKHATAIRAELGDSLTKMPKGAGTREAGN
ncbi:MAG: Arylsulfatase, partial [Prosthecobacter sp.]|nr:Arylsulfatase [Prosthecobacter sp.]